MVIRVDDLDIHQVRSPGRRETWLEGVEQYIWKATGVNKIVEFGGCFPHF